MENQDQSQGLGDTAADYLQPEEAELLQGLFRRFLLERGIQLIEVVGLDRVQGSSLQQQIEGLELVPLLKELMARFDLSANRMAELAGMDASVMRKILKGENRDFRRIYVDQLLDDLESTGKLTDATEKAIWRRALRIAAFLHFEVYKVISPRLQGIQDSDSRKRVLEGFLRQQYAALAQTYDEMASGVLTLANSTTVARITISEESTEAPEELSPDYLRSTVLPYLDAIAKLQHIIDGIKGQKSRPVKIREIRQYSPISVSLDGARDAVETVENIVIPWRRKHAKQMAQLAEMEKQTDIEVKRAEIIERRQRTARERKEIERLTAEATLKRAEAERMMLENEKLRQELYHARIMLALEVLERLGPNLSEEIRIAFVVELLEPLKIIVESPLLIKTSQPEMGRSWVP